MLDQMMEGLKLYGVLDQMKKYKPQLETIFTPTPGGGMTDGEFLDLLKVMYSDKQTEKEKEINTYKAMSDFVQLLYNKGMYKIKCL